MTIHTTPTWVPFLVMMFVLLSGYFLEDYSKMVFPIVMWLFWIHRDFIRFQEEVKKKLEAPEATDDDDQ